MQIKNSMTNIYNAMHWFSDADAWMLFRLAAWTEACTWAALIGSIIVRNAGISGADIAVSIAGTVHGTVLLVYLTFVIVLARSMEWGWKRIVFAFAAGNVPFATIVFERFVARYRRKNPVKIPEPPGYNDD